jgi:hypothetical protein
MPLRCIGIHVQDYMVSQPSRPQSGNYSLVQLVSFFITVISVLGLTYELNHSTVCKHIISETYVEIK